MLENQTIVLLVEHRDEVFARVASDMAERGAIVERARSGADALRRHVPGLVDLLVINADLPDISGWLLSSKVRMTDPEVSIWIYSPRPTDDDVSMANFVLADELIEYDGDLWRLSSEVGDRLGMPRLASGGSAGLTAGNFAGIHALAAV